MTAESGFEIFLATVPGLEEVLCAEVRGKGFRQPRAVPGGVVLRGGWPEVCGRDAGAGTGTRPAAW